MKERLSFMRNANTLTRLQKRLLSEVSEVAELSRLDYVNILDYGPEERTLRLRMIKNQIVRSQVIADYTFVDEMMGAAICQFFFGKKKSFITLWKTKKFKTFNHYILEVLSVPEKLRLVKVITKVPKKVAADIEALNALRNGLAHAFFPENLRSSKPIWKGKDIFSVEGLTLFIQDMSKISNFLLHHNFRVRIGEERADRQPEAVIAAIGP